MDRIDDSDGDVSTEGERRYVSLLFADICDYTALNEAVDPEDTDLIKRQLETLAAAVIARRGGAISQVYGDGILAVFGVRSPREDDARRALEAALDLHEATRSASWNGLLPPGFEIRLHSGVHAGLVFTRRGDALHGRYELTGDAVNTAARLSAAAGRDQVLASLVALRGFEEFFTTLPPAQLTLHGKKLPVPARALLGRSDVRTSFEARSRRGLTAFAGRDQELEQIGHTIRAAQQGRCQVIVVTGDAGIGKSRLLDELRGQRFGMLRVLRGCCDSYGETGPLEPFLQVLRQAFDLRAATGASEATALVDKHLERWGAPMQRHRTPLLQLLCLLPAPTDVAAIEAFRPAVASALSDLIGTLSAQVPLLICFDDWQWADDASRQLLARMCEDLRAAPVCVLLALRNGVAPQTLTNASLVVKLRPFTPDESRQVVFGLRPADFDTGLIQALHARSGGNPLFLEELCRSLPDRSPEVARALEQGEVPHTLHGAIQARVEALPAAQRALLRAAAVIGIEFPRALLEGLDQPAGMDEVLDALIETDLIYRGEQLDVFRFKHGITRDVIYESVRISERRRMHATVAAALERGATGPAEHAEALSYHHRHAGDNANAAKYSELAGDKAMAASSLDRARFHYAAAMAALDRMQPDPQLRRRWLGICDKWANPSSYDPAREQLPMLERASQYARELHDRAAEAQTSYFLGLFHYVLGDYARCVQAHDHALTLAVAAENHKLEVQLWSTLGQAHVASGAYDTGLPLLIRGIEHKRARQREQQRRPAWNLAHALGCKALVHADRGEFEQAERDFEEAFAVVTGTGHAMEASLLAHRAMSSMRQGLWVMCLDFARRARETAARTSSTYVHAMSEVFEAHARFVDQGEADALAPLRRAVGWLEARDQGLYVSVAHGCAAESHLLAGDMDRAAAYAMRALDRAERGDLLGEATAFRVLAQLSADRDAEARDQIEAYLQKAMRASERRGSAREVALTRLLCAQLQPAHASAGPSARETAQSALTAFERMQMPWYAEQARRLLGAT